LYQAVADRLGKTRDEAKKKILKDEPGAPKPPSASWRNCASR
jgi:hypothetical protein